MKIESYGIEVEMPVAELASGKSAGAKDLIRDLAAHWADDQPDPMGFSCRNGVVVAGYDNGFNNIEFAVGPVSERDGGLSSLNRLSMKALSEISDQLAERGLTVLNFSEHPACSCTPDRYVDFCLPRPIYDYWNRYRKWQHVCGIDAKAHTSPCTGIAPRDALTALNIIMGFSPAFIALYGNSPFEDGRLSGVHANRLNMWRRMFQATAYDGDNRIRQFPQKPFDSLIEYFKWMLGDGTVMHAVPLAPAHFKVKQNLYIVDENPSLFDFLQKDSWSSRELYTGETKVITAQPFHFEFHQFAQFSDARIRFGLKDVDIKDLREALLSGDSGFDEYFIQHSQYTYIEGRVPCTNLPDRYLLNKTEKNIADSMVVSSLALQAGLLENHEKALELIRSTGWGLITRYRNEAITKGLSKTISGFVETALEIADAALAEENRWMLAFPADTLRSGLNGAGRAIKGFQQGGSIPELIAKRRFINASGKHV